MRAGLYIRISTGEQSQYSLEGQKAELLKYCQQEGFIVAKIYEDQKSGLDFEGREGLQEALDDADKEVYDILLVTEMDRLARDPDIIGYVKHTLGWANNIPIRAINEPETKNEYEELSKGIIALIGKFEALRTKRRCQRGIALAKEQGKVLNRLPLGYKFMNGQVIVDEEVRPLIINIFQRFANNESIYHISHTLGLPKSSVRYLLHNPFYWNEEYLGKHEIIIRKR